MLEHLKSNRPIDQIEHMICTYIDIPAIADSINKTIGSVFLKIRNVEFLKMSGSL